LSLCRCSDLLLHQRSQRKSKAQFYSLNFRQENGFKYLKINSGSCLDRTELLRGKNCLERA
uniref:Uncharacterized protein n=1 Tax=Parascaris univalens TaxID=6257 RepID=A0A914ZQR2_PARUN